MIYWMFWLFCGDRAQCMLPSLLYINMIQVSMFQDLLVVLAVCGNQAQCMLPSLLYINIVQNSMFQGLLVVLAVFWQSSALRVAVITLRQN